MRIIDAHVHAAFGEKLWDDAASKAGVRNTLEGLLSEMDKNRIEKAVAISLAANENTGIIEVCDKSGGRLIPVAAASHRYFSKYWNKTQRGLKDGLFAGVKLYPGYEHFYPRDKKLAPLYRLCESLGLPVIFHTGITFDTGEPQKPVIRYAHPLGIDDLASEWPGLKILMAHSGNPWMFDAAAVLYKNDNVYADISGLFEHSIDSAYRRLIMRLLGDMVAWAGSSRVMFGTDWPLIRMKSYVDFAKGVWRDEPALEGIMHRNARKLFRF